jgi:uncharacterized spore protein YtfJ
MASLALLQNLHESLSTRAQVKSVFGDPVTAGDKIIIPVAKIAYGFGAGAGTGGVGESSKGEGGGGGGGIRATAAGVFEVGPAGTRFVPVRDRKQQAALLAAGAMLGMLLLRHRR